jgi:hypothetical protein
MLAPGAILQAMLQGILQGAGPVGCYYKVLTRRFVTGSSFLAQSAVTTPTYTGCGLQITS